MEEDLDQTSKSAAWTGGNGANLGNFGAARPLELGSFFAGFGGKDGSIAAADGGGKGCVGVAHTNPVFLCRPPFVFLATLRLDNDNSPSLSPFPFS